MRSANRRAGRPALRPRPWLAAALLGAALLVTAPARAAAQESAPAAATDTSPPPMAEAPLPFKLALSASGLRWSDVAGRPKIDAGALLGVDVERQLVRYLSVRFGFAVGSSAASDSARSTDLTQYLMGVSAQLAADLGPFRRAGAVPFFDFGFASVVHDPSDPSLGTRSQNAFSFGAGLDASLSPRFGIRGEWRHYRVDLEDVFASTSRSGRNRGADRWMATLYWRF